jgi:hypothetical protein
MNSTVRVGSQALATGEKKLAATATTAAMARERHRKSVIAIVTPTPVSSRSLRSFATILAAVGKTVKIVCHFIALRQRDMRSKHAWLEHAR